MLGARRYALSRAGEEASSPVVCLGYVGGAIKLAGRLFSDATTDSVVLNAGKDWQKRKGQRHSASAL